MPHRTPFPIATHLRSVHSDLRLLSALGHEVVRFPWCRRFDCGVGERVALGVGECDCEPVGRSLFYSEEGMTNGLSGPHGRCRGSVKGYLDDDDHAAFAPENPGSGISHSIPCGLCDTNGPSPGDELGSAALRVLWRRPESLSALLPPKKLRDLPTIHHEREISSQTEPSIHSQPTLLKLIFPPKVLTAMAWRDWATMAATRKELDDGREEELRSPRRHFDRAREGVVLRGEVLHLRGWKVGEEERALESIEALAGGMVSLLGAG